MNDWQNPLASQPEPELFPGSLIGYRQFKIVQDFDDFAVYPVSLSSLHFPGFFKSDEWMTAACLTAKTHPAPLEDCRCGFYISYLPDVLFDRFINFEGRAVVECAGKIVLATKGYRAARMRIRGLAVPSHFVPQLSELFPRVVPLEDWDSLVEEFPKSDYDSLVGTPVRDLVSTAVRRSVDNWRNQIVFNFKVEFDKMSHSLEEMGVQIKQFSEQARVLDAAFILPSQHIKEKKDEPRYANFKDLAKSYMALDVAETERLFISKDRTLHLQDFLKDEFPHTDT